MTGELVALQGQKLGAYRLHEIIGTGGFATVYRGTHESLGIDRAVKVLEDRYNIDQRVRELFVREGRRAATLDTPYVVRVQDAGESDGHAWLAMDLMTGGTLSDVLVGGARLAPDAVRRIGHDVALALAAAHAVDVLHRDVKPPNIFVMPDGGARLGDFGVAGELGGGTHASTIVGTFAYMAPETDDGQSTGKSDVYSLGAVLFEMSTGTRPPGLARRLPTWPPGVDSTLRPLIHRMLDVDPNVRPTSSEVAAELAVDGDARTVVAATSVRPPGARGGRASGIGGLLGGWTRGVSLPVAVAAAVVVVALGTGAAVLFAGGGDSANEDQRAGLIPPADGGGAPADPSASPEPPSEATPIVAETATATVPPEATDTATPAPTPTSAPPVIATIRPPPPTATATVVVKPPPPATATPPPTATPTAIPTPTPVTAPPNEVRISSITVQGSSYAVAFVTGFNPQLPGQHVHFFYNTVAPAQAGSPGSGPWALYAGGSPFTGYSVGSWPAGATQLCALFANANHSVNQNTGNCVALP